MLPPTTRSRSAIEGAVKAFGKLDILVSTVLRQMTPIGNTVELAEEDWDRAMAVNLTGVFLVCKYAIPELKAAVGGSIVIVASQLGQVAVPRRPAYVTSKAALIQLARSKVLDHAKDGIASTRSCQAQSRQTGNCGATGRSRLSGRRSCRSTPWAVSASPGKSPMAPSFSRAPSVGHDWRRSRHRRRIYLRLNQNLPLAW